MPVALISVQPVNSAPADQAAKDNWPVHGRIDLWHANLQQARWRSLLPSLSSAERRRADAFIFERDARRFAVSHAVLRILLSSITSIPASQLAFRTKARLKPFLAASLRQPLHFSLSRSEELVLIGFASRPLGVDIEWMTKTVDTESLGEFALSGREREAFLRVDPAVRQKAFLQCWIQKEAYLKAIGQGLHVSPAAVEVCFGPCKSVGLRSIAGNSSAAARWFVDIVMPREGYMGAVAIRGGRWRVEMTEFDTSRLFVQLSACN
jgi:4'-phosphopantetheinyl transferase